jgi:hypothetical protein
MKFFAAFTILQIIIACGYCINPTEVYDKESIRIFIKNKTKENISQQTNSTVWKLIQDNLYLSTAISPTDEKNSQFIITLKLTNEKIKQTNQIKVAENKNIFNSKKTIDLRLEKTYASIENSECSLKINIFNKLSKKSKNFTYNITYNHSFDRNIPQKKSFIHEENKSNSALEKLEITIKNICHDLKSFLTTSV